MSKPIVPPMPFVWPEPRVSSGVGRYETALPFEVAARAALSVFGVVSAIDAQAVNWMEGYLADSTETKIRLVISIHPTCRTSEADLRDLLRLVERQDGPCDPVVLDVDLGTYGLDLDRVLMGEIRVPAGHRRRPARPPLRPVSRPALVPVPDRSP